MREKGVTWFAVVIWMLVTACWAAALLVDFAYGESPEYPVALHVLTVVVSCAAAIVNFLRYRRYKKARMA